MRITSIITVFLLLALLWLSYYSISSGPLLSPLEGEEPFNWVQFAMIFIVIALAGNFAISIRNRP